MKLYSKYLFLIISVFLLFAKCTPDIQQAKDLDELENKIIIEKGRNVEIIRTDKGKPTIRIVADKAERFEDEPPYMVFPQGMEIFVYNDEGVVESVLKANYGKMAEGSQEMIAERDVVVTNVNGEQLNTEHLIWDSESQKIKSDKYIKISTEDEIIYGTGFIADENFTNYVIDSVWGIVNVKSNEF